MRGKLSATMTVREFENGYWYRKQLKDFGERIGIPAAAKLRKDVRIENYTSNRETKDFIIEQGRRIAPDVRKKPGVWYRLNRWREEQITKGARPTYGDLVRHYIALNRMQRFERIAIRCYNNFVAEFLAADKKVTRAEIVAAWIELKKLDVPKDYTSWVKARATQKRHRRTATS